MGQVSVFSLKNVSRWFTSVVSLQTNEKCLHSSHNTTLQGAGLVLIPDCVCLCVIPQLQRCKADLDSSLPPPLDSVVLWLQRAEAALTEDGGGERDHADAAKEARAQQDKLEVVLKMLKRFDLSCFQKCTIF